MLQQNARGACVLRGNAVRLVAQVIADDRDSHRDI